MKASPNLHRDNQFSGNRWRKCWTIKCSECGKEDTKFWVDLEDEQIAAKNFGNAGWDMRFTVCPACIRKARNKRLKARQRKPKVVPMTPLKAVPDEPRKLTRDERSKIRDALEQRFDDAHGCYRDGYSDQKIGKDLNIPWSHVRDIREAAFGAIESDPVLDGLKSDLAQAIEMLEAHQKEGKSLRGLFDELSKRIADHDKRLRS